MAILMKKRLLWIMGASLVVAVPAALLTRVAWAASAPKDAVQVQTALDGTGTAGGETNLGNLIADAVLSTGHAQIALVAADEIDDRAQVPVGKIEPSKIIHTLRYADDDSDTVVVLNLTGAQLVKALERSISRAPQPFEGFLQVSGLTVKAGGKTVSLLGPDGAAIQAGTKYRVATTRPVAGGSLGYYQVWDKSAIAEDTQVPVSKSLAAYLAAHRTLNSVIEGRIAIR